MSKQNVISARVNDEVLAMIDSLAASRERSRSWIVSKLIESAVAKQIEMDNFIQVGIDEIERGDFYTQEEMEAWVESLKKSRKKAA
ncbi:MAG: ribbon-helix-helix protein, CopG family [Sphingomonadales bacterium]|jgi:predicted transcriptional regulator|nr:ribbon-helix-helix protein, CopG family [Sphingomonadales bacterium]MBK9267643.1 ribbon-helix-helix protein, CopG family [Sphingomonadales bacterium]MBP6435632.1 ribbon-helix-helix protein, CopG family [Sphingorhabdus sp.]